jgi:hypothetical protein
MTYGKRMTTPTGPTPKSRSASFRNFDDRAIGRAKRRGYNCRVDCGRKTESYRDAEKESLHRHPCVPLRLGFPQVRYLP